MNGARTNRKQVWEAIVCESSQLAVETVCRRFAFQWFNAISIKDRKREHCLRPLHCWREEIHLEQLDIKWCSILTQARLNPVLSDAQSIDNTKLMCIFAGHIIVCRASMTSMSKMEHKAKFPKRGGLEEFTIPLFYEMKWWMLVGGNDALSTKLWMGKAMDTAILSGFNIAEITGWWSCALVFQENTQICIPMR